MILDVGQTLPTWTAIFENRNAILRLKHSLRISENFWPYCDKLGELSRRLLCLGCSGSNLVADERTLEF